MMHQKYFYPTQFKKNIQKKISFDILQIPLFSDFRPLFGTQVSRLSFFPDLRREGDMRN